MRTINKVLGILNYTEDELVGGFGIVCVCGMCDEIKMFKELMLLWQGAEAPGRLRTPDSWVIAVHA